MSKLSKWMKNNREAKVVKRRFIYNAKHALWSVLDFFVSNVEFMDISLYTSIYKGCHIVPPLDKYEGFPDCETLSVWLTLAYDEAKYLYCKMKQINKLTASQVVAMQSYISWLSIKLSLHGSVTQADIYTALHNIKSTM